MISGTELTGAIGVSFGSTPAASFTVNSSTQITASSPAAPAGTIDVTVTSPSGTSLNSASDKFTYEGAPSVASVSPIGGSLGGGSTVVITGTGLIGASAVSFGTVAATSYTVVSATTITAVSPAEPLGTVDVTVTTPAGTSSTSTSDRFTFEVAPTVTAISPASGSLGGGVTVVVTGTGFVGATEVDFGTVAAVSYVVTSSNSIRAVSPLQAAGTVDVTVLTPIGSSATSLADEFTYEAAPSVTSLSPVAGPLAGGTVVTVTGTGFSGASAVDFGSSAASYTVVSSTSLRATSPAASAGSVDVSVTSSSGTSSTGPSDVFTYEAAPSITAVSPAAGLPVGATTVTITGTGFTGASAVSFGATAAASYTIASATTITATSPAEPAGTVDVSVTTPAGTSASGSSDRFSFEGVPTVSALSPAAGPVSGGSVVTITGTAFTDTSAVSFGSRAASSYSVNSSTSITAVSPVGSVGVVDVRVTTPAGRSATSVADQFSYQALPTVTSLSPAAGSISGGTSVTITGSGFSAASGVSFGTTGAASYLIVSSTSILATTPPGSAGTVDVTVTTPLGTSATSASDKFTYEASPAVSALSPLGGPLSGGSSVTITGSGFDDATAVTFGTSPATSFALVSSSEIVAVAPARRGRLGRCDRDDPGRKERGQRSR